MALTAGRSRRFETRRSKQSRAACTKYQCLDLDVRFGDEADDDVFHSRLVVHPHLREDGAVRYLVTNLARESFTP